VDQRAYTLLEDYAPEQIAFWHAGGHCVQGRCNWAMLESAVQGGSGASGHGSGRGERFGLVHLKADLEHAADQLPMSWTATRVIFSRQHRYSVWLARWRMLSNPALDEPPNLPAALETAFARMARSLGWQEDQAA